MQCANNFLSIINALDSFFKDSNSDYNFNSDFDSDFEEEEELDGGWADFAEEVRKRAQAR